MGLVLMNEGLSMHGVIQKQQLLNNFCVDFYSRITALILFSIRHFQMAKRDVKGIEGDFSF